MSSTILFQLLHLADSALPTGGYAFSSGLEAAAKLKLIRSEMELRSYLEATLHDLAHFELAWLNGFLACETDTDALGDLVRSYHASFLAPSMQRASHIQGRGLLRFFERLHPGDPFESAIAPLKSDRRWLHFLPVFARSLQALGHHPEAVRRLFLFMVLRDQISAAVRLGLLGPTEGHALQATLFAVCETEARAAAELAPEDAVRSCPLIDVAQAAQPRLYSRLFQS